MLKLYFFYYVKMSKALNVQFSFFTLTAMEVSLVWPTKTRVGCMWP